MQQCFRHETMNYQDFAQQPKLHSDEAFQCHVMQLSNLIPARQEWNFTYFDQVIVITILGVRDKRYEHGQEVLNSGQQCRYGIMYLVCYKLCTVLPVSLFPFHPPPPHCGFCKHKRHNKVIVHVQGLVNDMSCGQCVFSGIDDIGLHEEFPWNHECTGGGVVVSDRPHG